MWTSLEEVRERKPGKIPEFTECLASCQKPVNILREDRKLPVGDLVTTVTLR